MFLLINLKKSDPKTCTQTLLGWKWLRTERPTVELARYSKTERTVAVVRLPCVRSRRRSFSSQFTLYNNGAPELIPWTTFSLDWGSMRGDYEGGEGRFKLMSISPSSSHTCCWSRWWLFRSFMWRRTHLRGQGIIDIGFFSLLTFLGLIWASQHVLRGHLSQSKVWDDKWLHRQHGRR